MKPYRHKLSREDAETRSIFLMKERWRDFPPPMTEFAVEIAGARFATRILAEDCECRQPRHQHLHLEAGHFADRLDFTAGRDVLVERTGDVYTVRNG